MKYPILSAALLWALALSNSSCDRGNERPENKSKIKEAVKDSVTQDFELYKGARDSLKQSEEKNRNDLDAVDKDLNKIMSVQGLLVGATISAER